MDKVGWGSILSEWYHDMSQNNTQLDHDYVRLRPDLIYV